MSQTAYITYKEDNVLKDAYLVELASEDNSYGIKNATKNTITVSSGTVVSPSSTGLYEKEFIEEANCIYLVSWKVQSTITSEAQYIVQQIGPFLDDSSIRAVADEKGSFVVGEIGTLLLRITDFEGNPVNPSGIMITITRDSDDSIIKYAHPEQVRDGFFAYEWLVVTGTLPGKYNIMWEYTTDAGDGVEFQTVDVLLPSDNIDIYSQMKVDLIKMLEAYIPCAQNIPVYFEQARPSEGSQTYQFTFPRWNQTSGLRVYRNKQMINQGFEVDYFHGKIVFDDRQTKYDVINADYNFRWFTDEQLYDFMLQALREINIAPPYKTWNFESLFTNTEAMQYISAVMYGGARNAIRTLMLCLQFQEPEEVFGGPEKAQQKFSNMNVIKENYEKSFDKIIQNKKFGRYPSTRMLITPEYTLPGGRSLSPCTISTYGVYDAVNNDRSTYDMSIKEAFSIFHSGIKLDILAQDDVSGKIVFAPVGYIFESGIKTIYNLKTKNGFSIKSSKEHLFYVNGDYIPLEQIKTGDKVITYKDGEILEDEVSNIINTGEEIEMYDMDVPSVKNLFADGIKCHNSRWFRYVFGSGT